MPKFYKDEIESAMKLLYNGLNEKDKRYFASISVMQLPHGGTQYISNLLGCDPKTIYNGKKELADDVETKHTIRNPGGGRKPIRETYPNLDKVFLNVLKEHTAGDPMNQNIIWTDLTKMEIVKLLSDQGICVSKVVVADLLKKHKYVKRKIQKKRK